MENKIKIPQGTSKEDKKQRKQFIVDFYVKWNIEHPDKMIYNKDLQDFINIRFLSIQETAGHASHTYKSTVSITYLTEILENAKCIQRVKPKQENKNQQRFLEMLVMIFSKETFGEIKLTVGILKDSKQKVQYCITAIE